MTDEQLSILLSSIGNMLKERIKALDAILAMDDKVILERHLEIWNIEANERLGYECVPYMMNPMEINKNENLEYRPTGEIKALDGLRNLLTWIREMERRLT